MNVVDMLMQTADISEPALEGHADKLVRAMSLEVSRAITQGASGEDVIESVANVLNDRIDAMTEDPTERGRILHHVVQGLLDAGSSNLSLYLKAVREAQTSPQRH